MARSEGARGRLNHVSKATRYSLETASLLWKRAGNGTNARLRGPDKRLDASASQLDCASVRVRDRPQTTTDHPPDQYAYHRGAHQLRNAFLYSSDESVVEREFCFRKAFRARPPAAARNGGVVVVHCRPVCWRRHIALAAARPQCLSFRVPRRLRARWTNGGLRIRRLCATACQRQACSRRRRPRQSSRCATLSDMRTHTPA